MDLCEVRIILHSLTQLHPGLGVDQASVLRIVLSVAHVRDIIKLEGTSVATDAVVVWRIVDGQITDAWDIPAVFTAPET